MKWEKVKLGDCCEITSSKRIYYSEYVESGIPFFRSKEIIELSSGSPISEPLYISQAKYETIKEKYGIPKPGDMLLTSVGTIGVPYIVKSSDCFYFKDGNLTWFRNFKENLLPSFLYHWVKSQEGYGKLYNATIGSSQKALTISALNNLEISLPPLPVQKKIAFVLSCYDDLIENCRKQIALLEEAAARLYRKWFVGKGEEEGWERKPLSEITSIVTGKKDANFGTKDGKYLFFTCGQEPIKAPSYSFDCNAVILAGNGDFNVKLYRGKFEAYQRTYVFSPYKAEHLYLLYFAIKENMRQLFQGASGSTIKFLTKPMLEKITVCIPEKDTLNKFTNCCEAYQSKIETLQRQISLLATARDLCLPRLMSGRGSDRE